MNDAAEAVILLLRTYPMSAQRLLDLVEERPELLSMEAEEFLGSLIAATAARAREEPSLVADRAMLERLRRTLRDCNARGVEAVRRDIDLPDDVMRDADGPPDQALIDWREGTILLSLGRQEEAVVFLKRSAAALLAQGRYQLVADIELILCDIIRGTRAGGDPRAAMAHAENAVNACRKAGDNAGLRKALAILAVDRDLYGPGSGGSDYFLDQLAEVDADFADWLRTYIRGTRMLWSDREQAGDALRWCADSAHLVSESELVQAHWRNECARKLAFIDSGVVPAPAAETATDQMVAALLALQNEGERSAAEHLSRAVPLAEKERQSVVTEAGQLRLSRTLSPVYHLAASVADRAGDGSRSVELLELNTSRSLLARLTMRRLWAGADAGDQWRQDNLKRSVVRYLAAVERGGYAGEQDQLSTALRRLRQELDAVEQRVLATAGNGGRIEPPVTLAALTGHLQADDIVLVYAPIGVIYAVTVAGVSRVGAFDTSAVERLCADYRRLAAVPDHDGDLAGQAALLEVACVDVVREVTANRRRVLIVPNEPLWGVPLGALGDRPLDTDHPVSYVPSLSVLHHLLTQSYRRRRVERFAGVGNPDGGLPYAEAELADAAGHFYDRTVQVGAGINVNSFLADLTEADIVHVASHGIVFNDYPDLSALHIAGTGQDRELLWASDVVQLNLRARVVVLAACHAGLSRALPGNEYAGLPGVFLVSGARSVLAPLWRVDDKVTAQFMAHFYRALPGSDPVQALRGAQLAVRADPVTAHPYYWAGFQLFGLP